MYWRCNNTSMVPSRIPFKGTMLLLALAGLTACVNLFPPDKSPLATIGGNPEVLPGEVRFKQVCAQCHGPGGQGRVDLKTPSIAGLPDWYVTIQIRKFQKGWRGTKPGDVQGVQMHAIARTLDPEAIRNVSGYIESLELVPTKVTLKGGNPKRGAELYRDLCMECHRFNGRGELAFRSSQLIGLQDWYIVSQLRKYRDGLRGAEKEDLDGIKMLRITNQMTDASFLDLSAHLAELADKYAEERPRRYLWEKP
jgi:cytochrome c553